ncbi:hypothetical protein ATCC90586_007272 [Pythium insidiosum]|nr:hypothetical protein ATCC90586_007272 [Pythium insidiosum]
MPSALGRQYERSLPLDQRAARWWRACVYRQRSGLASLLALAVLVVVVVNLQLMTRTWRARPPLPPPPASFTDGLPRSGQMSSHAKSRHVVDTLGRIASQQTTPGSRGIVLPLFDDIGTLGVSLILELRAMGVALPIEIPHCGDLSAKRVQRLLAEDAHVRVYDVCETAASMRSSLGKPLFCRDLADCHWRFRSFSIKVLALVLSSFSEVMLLDADTLFFESPGSLWDSTAYESTGTLFFTDRISYDVSYLAKRVPGRDRVSFLHDFMASFDAAPFRALASLPRPRSSLSRLSPFRFSFEPSDVLLQSHAWTLRAGHQMDSSLVLWNKARQPRATAILASFLVLDAFPLAAKDETQQLRRRKPPPLAAPSYGDKELYFLACELAETQYAFTPHAVATIGTEVRLDHGDGRSVLCGDALHYVPDDRSSDPRPLYINSDDMLSWNVDTAPLFRSVARPATLFPGSFSERGLPQTCPFNVSVRTLTPEQRDRVRRRQELHAIAQTWTGEDARNHERSSWWAWLAGP